jgi:hypothetical protein
MERVNGLLMASALEVGQSQPVSQHGVARPALDGLVSNVERLARPPRLQGAEESAAPGHLVVGGLLPGLVELFRGGCEIASVEQLLALVEQGVHRLGRGGQSQQAQQRQ